MAITSYDVNWNGHTGQEVQDFISGELQAIRTNTNKAIEKIEFIQDETIADKIYYKTTTVGGSTPSELPFFRLTAPSTKKVQLRSFDADKYVAPGNDLTVTFGYSIVDEAGTQIANLTPDVNLRVTNGSQVVNIPTFKASGKSYAGTGVRTCSCVIDSRYIREGVNNIEINLTYTDSDGTALMEVISTAQNEVLSSLTVLSFTITLEAQLSGIQLYNLVASNQDPFQINLEFKDGNGNYLLSYQDYNFNNKISTRIYKSNPSNYFTYTPGSTNYDTTSITNCNLAELSGSSSSNGVYTFYVQSFIKFDDNIYVYSNVVKFQVLTAEVQNNNLTQFAYTIPDFTNYNQNIVNTANITNNAQYEDYTFKVYGYVPDGKTIQQLSGEEVINSDVQLTKVGDLYDLNWTVQIDKSTTLAITDGTNSVSIVVNAISAGGTSDVATDFVLNLSANGKSGSNRDWSYNQITTDFSGFDWKSNGWENGALVVNNGALATINYKPCSVPISSQGRTVSIRFKTSDESANEAIISCYAENKDGFVIYPQKAIIYRGQQSIYTEFGTEDDYKEVTFVWHNSEYGNLSMIYVNGTSQMVLYSGNSASNLSNINITANDTSVYVSNVVAYERALTFNEVQALYATHKAEGVTEYFKENSVFNSNVTLSNNAQKVTIDTIPVGSTYMLISAYDSYLNKPWEIINSLPKEVNGSETKGWRIPAGETYLIKKVANGEPADEFNFYADKITFSGQGTSSMDYPIKNFRIYFNKKVSYPEYTIKDSDPEQQGKYRESCAKTSYFRQGSIVDSIRWSPSDPSTSTTKKYKLTSESIPVDIFCLKADYAESSGVHNTGFARLANYALETSDTIDQNLHESPKLPQNLIGGADYVTRSTIDGKPVYLFFRDSNGIITYHGKYNLNNEKATAEVYGFTNTSSMVAPYFNQDLANEVTELKRKFNLPDSDDSFEKTHGTFTYNGISYPNPNECWEFSTNKPKKLEHMNQIGNPYLYNLGAFTFPYTMESGYPFSGVAGFSGLDPFTEKFSDDLTKYAWLNTEQGWEYRYPEFDSGKDGDIYFSNGTPPYMLKELYKWVHKNNIYCWEKAGRSGEINNHLELFARDLGLYFNINYLLKYYVLTKWFINGDQRIKNCMLAFYYDPEITAQDAQNSPLHKMRAYYIFYDNDTILGVNNDGFLVNPWNAGETNSVFQGIDDQNKPFHGIWGNLEECYKRFINNDQSIYAAYQLGKYIQKAYQSLRAVLTDSKIEEFLGNPFPDSISNVDLETKYLFTKDLNPNTTDIRDKNSTQYEDNLEKYQGTREYHRKWLLGKRTKWFDAKYESYDALENYALKFKSEGAEASFTSNKISISSEFDDWRFSYYTQTGTSVSSTRANKNTPGILTIPTVSVSDTNSIRGLYAATEIDMSQLYGNMESNYLSSKGSVKQLPYVKKFIVGNETHPIYLDNTFVSSFARTMPNLRTLQINKVLCPNNSKLSLQLDNLSKLQEINVSQVPCDITLPNGSALTKLNLKNPSILELEDKNNLTNLTIDSYENLVEIKLSRCNDYLYKTLLNKYLQNYQNIALTVEFGTKSVNDVLSQDTIDFLLQIANLVNNGSVVSLNEIPAIGVHAGEVYIAGNGYYANITPEQNDILHRAFGIKLIITNDNSEGFKLNLPNGNFLYETQTISVSATKQVDNDVTTGNPSWRISSISGNDTNILSSYIEIVETSPYLCVIKANPINNNTSYNCVITVSAEFGGRTYISEPISVSYIGISSVEFVTNAENNIIDGSTTVQIILSDRCYKQHLFNTSNISGGQIILDCHKLGDSTVNSGSIQFDDNDKTKFIVTPTSQEDIIVNLTIWSSNKYSLPLYYNKIVCSRDNLTNDETLNWLKQLIENLNDFQYSSSTSITRRDLKKLQLLTTGGTLAVSNSSVQLPEGKTAQEWTLQDLTAVQYFGFNGDFIVPSIFPFSNLNIPEGATSMQWNGMIYGIQYGKITLPSTINFAFVRNSLENFSSNLQFDISNTNLTKIIPTKYGQNSANSGEFAISLTCIGQTIRQGSNNLFIYNRKITQIGTYNDNIGQSYYAPSDAIFNIQNPGSTSSYSPIYTLGAPINETVGINVGYVTSYKLSSPVFDWNNLSQYIRGLYYTFNYGGSPGSINLSNATNLTTLGDSCFNGATINIQLPNASSSRISKIGHRAFYQLNGSISSSDIIDVNVPNVTNVGAEAFNDMRSNKTFKFTKVQYIGNYCFNWTDTATAHTITLDQTTVPTLGDYAFGGTVSSNAKNTLRVKDNVRQALSAISDYVIFETIE